MSVDVEEAIRAHLLADRLIGALPADRYRALLELLDDHAHTGTFPQHPDLALLTAA